MARLLSTIPSRSPMSLEAPEELLRTVCPSTCLGETRMGGGARKHRQRMQDSIPGPKQKSLYREMRIGSWALEWHPEKPSFRAAGTLRHTDTHSMYSGPSQSAFARVVDRTLFTGLLSRLDADC